MYGHGPFLLCFVDCQVNDFDCRSFAGEYLSVSDRLSDDTVDAFDGVGGVDGFSNFRRVLEHGGDIWPMIAPAL